MAIIAALVMATIPVSARAAEAPRPRTGAGSARALEAQLLLDLDLLREMDLARERELLGRLDVLERLRVLEGLRVLESDVPIDAGAKEGR